MLQYPEKISGPPTVTLFVVTTNSVLYESQAIATSGRSHQEGILLGGGGMGGGGVMAGARCGWGTGANSCHLSFVPFAA